MSGVYYNPEEYDLEIIRDVDKSSGSYEFDQFVVWRNIKTNEFYFATDSGCSCPTPFENESLKTLQKNKFDKHSYSFFETNFDEWANSEFSHLAPIEVREFKIFIKDTINKY